MTRGEPIVPDYPRYSARTAVKAAHLREEEGITPTDTPYVYRSQSLEHPGVEYRVQLIPKGKGMFYVTCSCLNGKRQGKEPACYHSLAALREEWQR